MSPHWHSDTWPIICTAINLLDGSAAAVQVEEEGDEGDDDGAATGATNCSGSASRRIGKQDDGACAIIMNGLQGVQGLFNLIISVLGLGFSLFLCPFNHHITRYLTMGIEGSMYVLRLETPCTRKVGIRRGERDVECNIDVNTNTEKTRHGRKGSKPWAMIIGGGRARTVIVSWTERNMDLLFQNICFRFHTTVQLLDDRIMQSWHTQGISLQPRFWFDSLTYFLTLLAWLCYISSNTWTDKPKRVLH